MSDHIAADLAAGVDTLPPATTALCICGHIPAHHASDWWRPAHPCVVGSPHRGTACPCEGYVAALGGPS